MLKFIIGLLVVNVSFAAMDTIDSECRIQAKETAINTYQSCVKESRTQKIEEIRKEYQSKLQDLKSYYDGELKKMSLTPKSSDERIDSTPTVVVKKKNKLSNRSNGLPAKKASGKSLPVRNIEQEVRIDNSMATEGSSDATEVINVDDGSI